MRPSSATTKAMMTQIAWQNSVKEGLARAAVSPLAELLILLVAKQVAHQRLLCVLLLLIPLPQLERPFDDDEHNASKSFVGAPSVSTPRGC